MNVVAKLKAMGLVLPAVPKPVAAYVQATTCGGLVFVSGQLPMVEGKLLATGHVPEPVSVAEAQAAARQCALNGLAVIGEQIGGDWDRLVRIVKLGVYVASRPDFTDQAKVANGASEFLAEVLGDAGRHARASMGAVSLPLGAPVELEMVAEIQRGK